MKNNYKGNEKHNFIYRKIFYILILSISAALMSACAPTVVKTDSAKRPATNILILSGKGFVPTAANDPTYENTLFHVAKIYSTALNASLNKKGAESTLYISQNHDMDNNTILTTQIAKKHEDACIEVLMHHVRNSKENTIYLEAVFYPLVYQHLSNGHRRVIPEAGPSKSYPMLSTTQKDMRHASIQGLAEKFAQELKKKGYIK